VKKKTSFFSGIKLLRTKTKSTNSEQKSPEEPPEVVAPTQIEEIQEMQEIDFNEDFNPSAPAGKPESRADSALSTEPIQTIELEDDADLHR